MAGNPLEDLSVLQHLLGVMAAGRWHDANAFAALREGIAQTYTPNA